MSCTFPADQRNSTGYWPFEMRVWGKKGRFGNNQHERAVPVS